MMRCRRRCDGDVAAVYARARLDCLSRARRPINSLSAEQRFVAFDDTAMARIVVRQRIRRRWSSRPIRCRPRQAGLVPLSFIALAIAALSFSMIDWVLAGVDRGQNGASTSAGLDHRRRPEWPETLPRRHRNRGYRAARYSASTGAVEHHGDAPGKQIRHRRGCAAIRACRMSTPAYAYGSTPRCSAVPVPDDA